MLNVVSNFSNFVYILSQKSSEPFSGSVIPCAVVQRAYQIKNLIQADAHQCFACSGQITLAAILRAGL